MGRLIRRAAALGLLAALAGCSSHVSGHGAGEGNNPTQTGEFPTGPASTTPTATSSTSDDNGGGGGGGGGGNGGGGTKTATPSKPPTSSNAPTGLPQIQTYQAIAGPTCGGQTGTSQVTLTWRTTNSTEVWIQISQVAFDTGDPKVSGGIGPLAPSGTKTLPFDCVNDNLYYKLRAYNPTHNTDPAGINLQVPRGS
jgi:hypothetical protein